VLKLKTARFTLRTRTARLSSPTVLPDCLFDLARSLLAKEANGVEFRLTGIGAHPLVQAQARIRGISPMPAIPGT
jgi:DNA polymerase-4